jgi:hypothetical protein
MRIRLFIVPLMVMIALLAACNLGETAPTATPAPTARPTLTPTAPVFMQLSPYVSRQFGYRITYPTGMILREDVAGRVTIEDQMTIEVTGLNPAGGLGGGMTFEPITDLSIAGEVARRYAGTVGSIGGNTPQTFEMVAVPHNSLYYVFTIYELKIGEVQPIDRTLGAIPESDLATFYQIVSSLEFVRR